jgi:hypothetical protein
MKKFTIGPVQSKGSDEVHIVFKYSQKLIYKTLVILEPDSLVTTLVADFDEKVDFTTFMDNDRILLKIANRFMVFNNIGEFVDEVEFKDLQQEQIEEF